jgi:hypothetical protein
MIRAALTVAADEHACINGAFSSWSRVVAEVDMCVAARLCVVKLDKPWEHCELC